MGIATRRRLAGLAVRSLVALVLVTPLMAPPTGGTRQPMCFSVDADLVAGFAVGAIGIDALRHTRRPAEKALAALPVVLAGHQLTEAFVWWGLQDRVPDSVWRPALWLYLAVAF